MKKCFVTVASIILLIIVGVLTTVIIAGKRINNFDNKENKKSFIEITPSSTQKAVDEILPGDTSDLGNSAVMPSDSGDIHPSKEPIQNKGTLMADPIIWDYFGGYPNLGAYPVFGSDHRRHEISAISFLDSLTEAPENAFDVSEEKNGTVIAWFVPDADADGLYKMYIAGNGGVNAPSGCEAMFAGYEFLKKIEFHGFYGTGNVTSMYEMFFYCSSLIALYVSSFKTGNVESMHDMFGWCKMLRKLDVSRFDTGNVTGMDRMFPCVS